MLKFVYPSVMDKRSRIRNRRRKSI